MSVNITRDSIFRQEVTSSPAETKQMAGRFAENLQPGDLVAFYGDLGSGKTVFIKAICEAFGVSREVTSPTFTIINQYVTTNSIYIYHFDFYRLENLGEVQNLGLEEFFYNDYLCLVEWADKIESYLPVRRWNVIMDFVPRLAQARKITIIKRDGN